MLWDDLRLCVRGMGSNTAFRSVSAATLENTGIPGLSKELQGKLNQQKPETIGQASRIHGMTLAAVGILLVWLKCAELLAKANEAA